MDRLTRTLAGCGLVALLAAPGCKSTRPEVPPGHTYSGDGRQVPSVGFSSEPRPLPNNAAGLMPGGPSNAVGQFGTPAPGSGNNGGMLGAPTGNAYGPPGTSGLSGGSSLPGQGISPSLADPAPAAAPTTPALPAESSDRPDPTQSPLSNYNP